MDSPVESTTPLSHLPYTHCKTRIVSFPPDLPEEATDEEYRQICSDYMQASDENENARNLRDAIASIKYGIAPPVAFPTETVYGLGADATNAASVSGIFAAKGRPNDNPLIVHVSSESFLKQFLCGPVPDIYKAIIDQFWPGPLTILLPVPERSPFATNVHPGQSTIGFRMPSSKYARFFIAASERPIAGPSANSSGKPSPTTAQHVLADLDGKINYILDGGPCDVGVESTVVDGLHDPPLILRPGGVSLEELRSIGGKWANTATGYRQSGPSAPTSTSDSDKYLSHLNGAPRAPGMKYRHYSPRAKVVLFGTCAVQKGRVEDYLRRLIATDIGIGNQRPVRVGFISYRQPHFFGVPLSFPPSSLDPRDGRLIHDSPFEPYIASASYGEQEEQREQHQQREQGQGQQQQGSHALLFNVAMGRKIEDLARDLFGALRLCDDLNCDYIFAEVVQKTGGVRGNEGSMIDAVADRLGKAAAERVDS